MADRPVSDWRQVFTPERADDLLTWVDGLPSNVGAEDFSHRVYDDGECIDDCPACALLTLIASRGEYGL